MADLSNSSFIPKRGPGKKRGGNKNRRIYIFTVFSYILLFATLLASGAVFFYTGYLERQLEQEVATFNEQTRNFSVADYERVQAFDRRLTQATSRVDKSASLPTIFSALEAATIDTIQIVSLNLEREDDERVLLNATIETDSFDSTIFQRSVYTLNDTIATTTISDVQSAGLAESTDTDGEEIESEAPGVTFTAEIETPLSAIPYRGDQVVEETSLPTAAATSTDEVGGPQNDSASLGNEAQDI